MKTGDKVIVNDKGRFRQYTPDYANVDIKAQIRRLEMKHGKETVLMAIEEHLREWSE